MNFLGFKRHKVAYIIEYIKWTISIALLVLIIIYNYIYQNIQEIFRDLLVSVLMICMGYVILSTKKFKIISTFIKKSIVEVYKIFWPTYIETLQMTFIVFIITVIISIILWLLDYSLIYLISFLIR
ncbi:preprotein translocase subunit SecE [Enterobacteriaceae endosymbiont of Macroplea appendiculata]|uniref:preprotein translocase subunit SecE n=1 Tax=Enterobacteriaceae endosymbiont of Macroplea appendiculata TaxID=2675790 RepID=UPI001448A4F2|nr:preprotein translocase subunit SecE [Enterobacteriaceae endosymbiont of Macroplea appendiculata]QJC30927.1 preprotein translocase subunit SecE [Enterobacteriaceae endosymbiont of Macroplea appendiculata]